MGERYSARCDKRDRRFERTGAKVTAKVVAKVGAIRQIKELNERRDIVTLFDPEVLRDARVKLEKRLAAKIVKRGELTLPRPQAVSEFSCAGTRRTARVAKCGESRFQIGRAAREDDRVRIAAAASLPQHIRVIDCIVGTC